MSIRRNHFNVSRHVRPSLLMRIKKKFRLWKRSRNVNLARRRLFDVIALDRAEIYDPLYAAKRDAYEARKTHG